MKKIAKKSAKKPGKSKRSKKQVVQRDEMVLIMRDYDRWPSDRPCDDAIDMVGRFDPKATPLRVWKTCDRGDFMLWIGTTALEEYERTERKIRVSKREVKALAKGLFAAAVDLLKAAVKDLTFYSDEPLSAKQKKVILDHLEKLKKSPRISHLDEVDWWGDVSLYFRGAYCSFRNVGARAFPMIWDDVESLDAYGDLYEMRVSVAKMVRKHVDPAAIEKLLFYKYEPEPEIAAR